jgi:cyclohexanecarboxylate-CoA ligase
MTSDTTVMTTRLRVTHRHSRATAYRRPGGPWDVPSLEALLLDAQQRPEAVVDGAIRLSSHDVALLAARLAGGLRGAGVRRRDVVAWQLPNGFESVLLYRACWRLGAVAAPLDPDLSAPEVARAVELLDPTVCVGGIHLPLGSRPRSWVTGGRALPSRRRGTETGTVASDPHRDFATLLAAAPEPVITAAPSDPAVALLATATTVEPGVVLHTHRTLACTARGLREAQEVGPGDTVLSTASLAGIAGLLQGLVVPGLAGAGTVLVPRWNPGLVFEVLEREGISQLAAPPDVLVGLVSHPSRSAPRLRALRLVSTSGTDVSEVLAALATDHLQAPIQFGYGSTEAPFVAIDRFGEEPAHRRVVSPTCDHTELRVVDPGSERDVSTGAEGELWVRSPNLFAGYLSPEDTTAVIARGGWFRTGDRAVLDEEGRLRVTGRLPDAAVAADPQDESPGARALAP